jgi:hypothetical protein
MCFCKVKIKLGIKNEACGSSWPGPIFDCLRPIFDWLRPIFDCLRAIFDSPEALKGKGIGGWAWGLHGGWRAAVFFVRLMIPENLILIFAVIESKKEYEIRRFRGKF